MSMKEDHFSLNDIQVNRIININNRQMSNSIMKFNSDTKKYDEGKRSMISFNLFDYYCFRKITKKKLILIYLILELLSIKARWILLIFLILWF